jgi:hypothetical protein
MTAKLDTEMKASRGDGMALLTYNDAAGASTYTLDLTGGLTGSANWELGRRRISMQLGSLTGVPGEPDNDPIYVRTLTITDLDTNSGTTITGEDYDPSNNLMRYAWRDFATWSVNYKIDPNFDGVDLSRVASMTITLGDGSTTATGQVRLDHIRLQPAGDNCNEDGDIQNGPWNNCRGDYNDLWLLGRDWLDSNEIVTEDTSFDEDGDPNLVAYFPMNEASGSIVSTVGGFSCGAGVDGDTGRSVVYGVPGVDGNAIDLNRTGWFQISTTDVETLQNELADAMTLSVWVKQHAAEIGSNIHQMLDAEMILELDRYDLREVDSVYPLYPTDGSYGRDSLRFRMNNSGNYQCRAGGGMDNIGNGSQVYVTYEPEVWKHLAYVINPAENFSAMYVDGVMTQRNGGMTAEVSRELGILDVRGGGIGGDRAGSTAADRDAFNGALDELRMYKRALSHGEILHLAGKASVEQHLETADASDNNDDNVINFYELADLANIWGDDNWYVYP